MAIRITDFEMTSDQCDERAHTDDGLVWRTRHHPGRDFDRNQTVTAMVLAEALASNPDADSRLLWHIESWQAELGITPEEGRR